MSEFPNQTTRLPQLTLTETNVLKHVATGMSSKEVAEVMELSKRTVDFHLTNIYEKLNVGNRLQASNKARELGLLS